MARWKRSVLILLTIILCVGADQITKVLAKSHLPKNKVLSFAGDTLRLDYAVNKGAVLTFEYSLPEKWRGPVFTVAVSSLLVLIILFMLFAPALWPLSVIALSLFCGGTLSNLLDRTLFGGSVVDFLNIGWGGIRSGIFNVADIAISIGSVLFVLSLMWNILLQASKRLVGKSSGKQ